MHLEDKSYHQIMDYMLVLEKASMELRSKLTSISLFTENNTDIPVEEKECILNIADIINNKSDELIFVEAQLKSVIKELSNSKNSTQSN